MRKVSIKPTLTINNLVLVFYTILACIILGCSEEGIEDNGLGTLTGKVVAKGDNIPLENVKISSTPTSTTVFTDANGEFSIASIQVGEYSFQAELPEYDIAFEPVSILNGLVTNAVFELDSLDAANLRPSLPILLFPEDGAENVVSQTELVWRSSENDKDEITYDIELRESSSNNILNYNDVKDTTLIIENLAIGKTFFWQVTASDGISESVKSKLSSFSTTGGESNRFFYVRIVDGNNVIFSGDINNLELEDVNSNELQLTPKDKNSYRPIKNVVAEKIAYLSLVGGETQLFAMNTDGANVKQLTTTIPLAGFRQEQLEYAWYDNGAKIYYPNFNSLYTINADGTGQTLVYEAPVATFISEVATNPTNNLVAIKTNDANGYNARIVIVDVSNGTEVEVVIEGISGALGGLDYSIDGNRILYTRDISGNENAVYRILDSRIYEYDITTNVTTEIFTGKEAGTNDLDAKYSPDDGSIIFMNTSNDDRSEQHIYKTVNDDINVSRRLLFTNAFMPNWE